ncbi:MAG: hypothetical protein KDD33_08745 [Bdellovibrionales bacterium]|nr:hypothetical protein [Bdellovibrionales bacterium]
MKNWLVLLTALAMVACSPIHSKVADPGDKKLPPPPEQKTEDPIDYQLIEEQLTGEGLGGWVHAAAKDQQVFVFTWRHPDNFFINVQLPLMADDLTVWQKIGELKRHDYVVIKGKFADNGAPIKHLQVSEIVDIKKYEGPSGDYNYKTDLVTELQGKTEMIAKVHIVTDGGAAVVVEYGDRVIPVFNSKPALAANLYRNDKILLKFRMRAEPNRPIHLNVDTSQDEPIKVLEAIVDGHDTMIRLCGPLVMFPKSPQIKFNVYALRTEDFDSIRRNYTIVNFTNIELFMKIREKLEEAWNSKADSAVYDRNKFINRKIMVCASGKKNVVDPTQANAQVMPEALEDVELYFSE